MQVIIETLVTKLLAVISLKASRLFKVSRTAK